MHVTNGRRWWPSLSPRYCTGESSRSASDLDRSTEYNRRWEPESISESLEVIPILNWETEVQQARISIHNIFISRNIPSRIYTIYTLHVGRRHELRLRIGIFTNNVWCHYRRIASLFHRFPILQQNSIMQGWLERYPRKASVIRLAGEGEAYDQF
ncbi:uncharacterized protein LOC110898411 [Helianthus annuus]|uniref:uncharacterized protein LOC110898411 n=1 Tax=Helianthus annuus TaxID=4232 RepID=UPI001652DB6A|nr:uncharacterized protein LOC110898411 [Helianthus annuus]